MIYSLKLEFEFMNLSQNYKNHQPYPNASHLLLCPNQPEMPWIGSKRNIFAWGVKLLLNWWLYNLNFKRLMEYPRTH